MDEAVSDPYLRHLFNADPIFNVYNTAVTNLSVGAPGPDLLKDCARMMMEATRHRLEAEEREGMYYLFQYGVTPGLWECRDELAKFLARRYGDSVRREHLVLTCGATHGLQLLLNTLVSPNGVIFVEEVTYMIALDVFKQFPLMKVMTVPLRDELLDLDAFERILTDEKTDVYHLNERKIFWAMLYTIPTYHNPTGLTFPEEMCQRLVDIARKHSIAVVCDDVYNLLHYGEGLPPRRLRSYDDPSDPSYRGGNVISNGSFSKILSPAVRLGWIEGSPRVVNSLKSSGILCSGGAVNHYVSGVIASLLHLKAQDAHLDKLVATYKERLKALCEALDRYLPSCCSYNRPNGGYFVWLRLPKDVDGARFVEWCQAVHKVSAIPGSRFSVKGEMRNYLRLSIAFHPTESLRSATKTICLALLEYIRDLGTR